ncbi:hypothetical protein V499_08976 [Pseudogymnoascus sp. VKM F-103]|uniref:Uncharacterized protein n=1 Tax=Pseudogymnoascus verrucosus TaxID=342668 RepID=A0A1B8GIC9_9PEZI|nr:uncharacterized protein VE01_05981 [Pseudogymnoascus verrucosus]KFY70730.1 hypothetical protein V499_08976 [Pseudogymnoascus sp. VKM F-103]OBT95568.1 hypothetical protein VE01_05981 [Pseudogymnoascus verrucosus]
MGLLKTLLRSIGLQPRSIGDAGEESGPLVLNDEKKRFQSKESTCSLPPYDEKKRFQETENTGPPPPCNEKKEPQAKSGSEKNPTARELVKQIRDATERTTVATKRIIILTNRSRAATKRTVHLLELLIARAIKVELNDLQEQIDRDEGITFNIRRGLRAKEEVRITFLPGEKKEPQAKPRVEKDLTQNTQMDILKRAADDAKYWAEAMERRVAYMERSVVANERTAKIVEQIVADN